jgi:hypothetical protein
MLKQRTCNGATEAGADNRDLFFPVGHSDPSLLSFDALFPRLEAWQNCSAYALNSKGVALIFIKFLKKISRQ